MMFILLLSRAGLYNIISGALFKIPMPVQPMKSIAAVALAEVGALSLNQLLAAGICVSFAVLLLGITGLIETFNRAVPASLIRGIQLGLGMKLALRGFDMSFFDGDEQNGHVWKQWTGMNGISTSLLTGIFVLVTTAPRSRTAENGQEIVPKKFSVRRVPAALLVILMGLIYSLVTDDNAYRELHFGPGRLATFVIPSISDFKTGFLRGAVPQLPLTTLNSVLSVCALAKELFPTKSVTCRGVSSSVGVMNLVGCWFGAMPCYHGAGGLAAQYRFGARTGSAVLALGVLKLFLGLSFGSSLMTLLSVFPQTLLGILMSAAALELASSCRKQSADDERGTFEMLVTASVTLWTGTFYGFLSGAVTNIFLTLLEFDWMQMKTELFNSETNGGNCRGEIETNEEIGLLT